VPVKFAAGPSLTGGDPLRQMRPSALAGAACAVALVWVAVGCDDGRLWDDAATVIPSVLAAAAMIANPRMLRRDDVEDRIKSFPRQLLMA
jgi:hypothetical protein